MKNVTFYSLTAEAAVAQGAGAPHISNSPVVRLPELPVAPVGQYSLAIGEEGEYRLRLLHNLYGVGSRQALLQAGLERGMHVADIGCGVGTVTQMLGVMVGPDGCVAGIDMSGQQLRQARMRTGSAGLTNITFVEASAAETGLPSESFDLVYCRFLLLHLTDPAAALKEMRRILKPGGIVVCEDGDLSTAGSEPPS